MNEAVSWIVIAVCIVQSGVFSGLNLALFGVTRLRLEIEATLGNPAALKVLRLREKSNLTLSTVLWGNVAVNTLLAIVSNSVLTGIYAFIFSTVFITFFGEIMPQAYFSRHALRMAAALSPVLRIYQVLLYPVAKPSSLILDWWLGPEGIQFFREHALHEVIKKHIEAVESDVDAFEGTGALNFLVFDDLPVSKEGEPIDDDSIIQLPHHQGKPVFPEWIPTSSDPFLRRINESGKKWVIIINDQSQPTTALDADGFLRDALFDQPNHDPYFYCHQPVIITEKDKPLGDVVWRLQVSPENSEDDVIDKDLILVWGEEKKIITGADILGRLLHGIVSRTG